MYSTIFLTSALEGGEWSASHSSCFTPRERGPSIHWTGDWVGPRASLDKVEKRKIPPNPDHPAIYINFKNAYDSVRREELSILI
jgi:hypothetical protein